MLRRFSILCLQNKGFVMLRKVLIGLLIALVIIQFVRPERNTDSSVKADDITARYDVPANVQAILKRACNDCHSNYTAYPWYANIQPLGLWLQHHIDEGKAELNFSIFNTYSDKKKAHKMEEVAEMVERGEMPLESYTLIHGDAKLTKKEAQALITWAKTLQQQIQPQ
jgi:hypothetical protein